MHTKTLLISLFALLLLNAPAAQAQLDFRWSTVKMDASFDGGKDFTATKIIAKYDPLVTPLQEIIGYSEAEYAKSRPESGLSNFAADVIRERAEAFCGEKIDIGLTNFGGIRTSLPRGAVRVYDIYSIFPFENYIVIFDIKGKDLKRFFRQMAYKCEALSNVKLVIRDGRVESLLIGGEPFDEEKTYKFATINFLMNGGDGVSFSKVAMNRIDTQILIRDAIIDHIRKMTAENKTLQLNADGRVTVIK